MPRLLLFAVMLAALLAPVPVGAQEACGRDCAPPDQARSEEIALDPGSPCRPGCAHADSAR